MFFILKTRSDICICRVLTPYVMMSQHFLVSAKSRSISIAAVARISDADAETMFAGLRWPETGGKAVCPHCGCPTCYEARRANGNLRYRCKACRKDFSITSGTLFAHHKLPLRTYLLAVVIFCNEVKGKSALALSRDLDVQLKTAYVLAHKLREAMGSDMIGRHLGGRGKVVEIDGAYFGGHVRPHNEAIDRRDRRKRHVQSINRLCVVVVRERGGRTHTRVMEHESRAEPFITRHVDEHTVIMADEANSWNALHRRYEVKQINHTVAFSLGGACTNQDESFFSRLRRAEWGHHHHISGRYLDCYAAECAWREDHRRLPNGSQVHAVIRLALAAKPSLDFTGYWQRAEAKRTEHRG